MKNAFGLLLALSVVFAGLGLLDTHGLTAAVLVGGAFFLVSLPAIRRLDPEGRMRLDEIFALAVALRWAMAVVSFLVISKSVPGLFAPDELFYDSIARDYAEFLAGHAADPNGDSSPGGVIFVSGVTFWLLGYVPMVPRFLNGVLGGWTAVVAGLIAQRLANSDVGRRTAFIAAVVPSLVLWASLNTKDNSTLLGAELALWSFLILRERFAVWRLALFAGSLLLVAVNRPYELMFVGGGVVAGFLFSGDGRLARNIALSAVVGGTVVVLARATGATDLANGGDDTLTALNLLREGYTSGAGSAIDLSLVDTSTAGGMAMWTPIGLFYYFFAPIPFTGRTLVSLATTPEMICWYLLIPSAWRGLLTLIRYRLRIVMPLVGYLACSSIGWSLVITNVGTLYRYRSQGFFIPIICVAMDQVRRRREASLGVSVSPEVAYVRALVAARNQGSPAFAPAARAGR